MSLSGGRFVLGVGAGWARQEFDALGVPFAERGRLTDECLQVLRDQEPEGKADGMEPAPVWVGGNSAAAIRRTVRWGDAWHPRAAWQALTAVATQWRTSP
jgi:alkanesulfonate monooxygenase SsuD/methylene tetrahydromethanopterin reductase-like flavin-dependent oxidoreductase (luciferase family)